MEKIKPLDLIFGGVIVGLYYEIVAHCYREDKFKSIFRFGYKYPGYSMGIMTGTVGLGWMYGSSIFKKYNTLRNE